MSDTARPRLKVSREDRTVWRVGFVPEPWAWTPWEFAHNGHFPGRWDDPEGKFRTLYAGEGLLACFLEVLACFRPDLGLVEELDEIEENETGRDSTARAGVLPVSWLDSRTAASARVVGRFCAISHSDSISTLRPVFLPLAKTLGLFDFDSSALKDSKARALTQQVAAHLFRNTGIDGVQFASRHGDNHQLWAIFERTSGTTISPCLVDLKTVPLTADLGQLAEAMASHGIEWG